MVLWTDILVSTLILIGAVFAVTGSIGLLRFRDFYMRLHGPTKSTTVGVGAILIASILYFSLGHSELNFQELLVAAFLFMTAPVSAHLVSKAALHSRISDVNGEVDKHLGSTDTDSGRKGDEPEVGRADGDTEE